MSKCVFPEEMKVLRIRTEFLLVRDNIEAVLSVTITASLSSIESLFVRDDVEAQPTPDLGGPAIEY